MYETIVNIVFKTVRVHKSIYVFEWFLPYEYSYIQTNKDITKPVNKKKTKTSGLKTAIKLQFTYCDNEYRTVLYIYLFFSLSW